MNTTIKQVNLPAEVLERINAARDELHAGKITDNEYQQRTFDILAEAGLLPPRKVEATA